MRQRHDRDDTEARCFDQHSQRASEILHRRLQERQPLLIAIALARLRDAADRDERVAPCVSKRHAGAEVVIDRRLEVGIDFARQIVIVLTIP
jgi:hypothetical protein